MSVAVWPITISMFWLPSLTKAIQGEADICWTKLVPWICCHPRAGREGFPECAWDRAQPTGLSFEFCCNQSLWSPEVTMQYQQELLTSWMRRCRHEDPGDLARSFGNDHGEAVAWADGIGFEVLYFFEVLREMSRRIDLIAGGRPLEEAKVASATLADDGKDQARVAEVQTEVEAFVSIATNPSAPLFPKIQELLRESMVPESPARPRILEVGSGPISRIGSRYGSVDVQVEAVDILACEYARIREDLGLRVPEQVVPQKVATEDVDKVFGEAVFDLVYCSNSLDHTKSPVEGLVAMMTVVKPGGSILLQHYTNTGVWNDHGGFHHWNFDLEAGSGRFLLWRPALPRHRLAAERLYVADALLERGMPLASVRTRTFTDEQGLEWVEAIFWKER